MAEKNKQNTNNEVKSDSRNKKTEKKTEGRRSNPQPSKNTKNKPMTAAAAAEAISFFFTENPSAAKTATIAAIPANNGRYHKTGIENIEMNNPPKPTKNIIARPNQSIWRSGFTEMRRIDFAVGSPMA